MRQSHIIIGGLYGRILTEVVSTDLTALGLYTRPRSRFSHKDRLSSGKNNNWFVLTDILLANSDEPNLILPKFAHPLYFFLIGFLALTEINIVR